MTDKSSKVVEEQKQWRMLLSPEQRKQNFERIVSIDGIGDRGQFYITAQKPGGTNTFKMVVTASFLDKSGKKLSPYGKSLFRVGAPLIWKWSKGNITDPKTATKTMAAVKATYMDVTGVLTAEQEAEWIKEGLL